MNHLEYKRTLTDEQAIEGELRQRIEELEQWIAAIADDHPQIPDWIQQSARSVLAQGVSNERNHR